MAGRQPLIEPYRPYEPDEPQDYEYDDDVESRDAARPRVLWGRVAALGGALLLAFLIGRTSAPNGVPAEDLERVRDQAREAEAEVESLRDELAALQAEAATLDEEKADEAGDEPPAGEGGDRAKAANKTYIVEPGDTLTIIAEEVYGDASLDELIKTANPDIDPEALQPGQELVIPPKPEDE